jgi:hypothetical protein
LQYRYRYRYITVIGTASDGFGDTVGTAPDELPMKALAAVRRRSGGFVKSESWFCADQKHKTKNMFLGKTYLLRWHRDSARLYPWRFGTAAALVTIPDTVIS